MQRFKLIHAYSFLALGGCLLASVSAYPLYAQQAAKGEARVDVRVSAQDDFLRFVFSGGDMPQARIAQEAGSGALNIKFNEAVRLNMPDLANVSPKVDMRHDGRDVNLSVDGMARQRHVRLGQRLLVDIFTKDTPKVVEGGAENTAGDAPAEAATAPQANEGGQARDEKGVAGQAGGQNTSQVTAEGGESPRELLATDLPPSGAVDAVISGADSQAASPAHVQGEGAQSAPKADEIYQGHAIITFGSTHGLMMAAFERAGDLWVVSSGDAAAITPQVTGANAADVALIDSWTIDGGTMYRFRYPENARMRVEGGGLIWRLHVGNTPSTAASALGTPDISDRNAGPQLKLMLPSVGSVLRITDPESGEDLAALLVSRGDAHVGMADSYVDFQFVPALIGAIVRPKVDGFSVSVLRDEVLFGRRDGGLRFSNSGIKRADTVLTADDVKVANVVGAAANGGDARMPERRLYDFDSWGMGGVTQFFAMRRAIDMRIATAEEDAKLPEIINGAKFMLAQGLPHEALGYLEMAQNLLPLLRESADFQAIAGATYALLGHNQAAIEAYKNPGLVDQEEAALWKAFAHAREGQMDAAQEVMPRGLVLPLIASYPARIQMMIIPPILDAVLERGDVRVAEGLIDIYDARVTPQIDLGRDDMLAFYRGRAALLRGNQDEAEESLKLAANGLNGPYPVRATLMLVDREMQRQALSRDEAVQRLERFRFGWRGDEYEREIMQTLGMLYINSGEQRRGLSILRGAAALAPDKKDRDALIEVMRGAFRDLFTKASPEDMSAVEAAAVASEFAELMPTGEDGEDITVGIATKMVEIDLLDRAAGLLEPLSLQTKEADKALEYAQRAASIRLLDRKPRAAIEALNKIKARPDVGALLEQSPDKGRKIALLAAQAKADMNQTSAAVADIMALKEGEDSLRLLTDISWRAQNWAMAADALGRLIAHANLNATQTPTSEQAQMVLNRALALNLAGDTQGLENLSLGYRDIMRRTPLYRPFLVVTRSSREAQLADRETLMALVSEVALFKDVLESYKNNELVAPSGLSD